jgi:hypothetical protein
MSDDIEDVLARLKPSGVAPEMRPRVLEAVAVELAASQGTTLACVHPSGHRFICDRCGIVAQPSSRARRWAMTAVTVAMTSAAAVLLMIVIADRQGRNGERAGQAISMNSRTGGQSSIGATATDTQTKHAPAIETASASQKSGTSNADIDASSRFLSAQRPDGRRILSAAGFELLDGRIAQLEGPAVQNHTSAIDIESNDARITNGALLDSILLKVGVGGSSADPSHRQSTILPGSRS